MDNKKLVSKNSIQKFKWGNKIIKADNGIVLNILGHKTEIGPTASKVLRKMKRAYNYYKVLDARTPVPDPFRYLDNKIGKAISWMDNTFVIKNGHTPENGGTINNRLIEQQQQARQNKTSNISFKQAFNNARNSGLKEFTWGGKRFNTRNKGEENYIFSNGKWINPNIKFTVSPITESTQEEMKELDRKAKPIINFAVPAPTDMTSEEIDKLNSKAKPIWEGATFAKKGGNLVPKFQTPWGTLMLNKLDERQQALQDFSNKGINQAKQIVSPMEKQTKKAHNRNNKIASLQLQLWNSGAFNGVIDKRTGKQVTYERAVDGMMGGKNSMTRQAMENNKKRREAIPLSPRNQQINQQKTKFITTSGPNIPSQIFELNNNTYTSSNSRIQPLNLDQASELYQNGTSGADIYLSGLYHAIAPESWAMPHSEGLKNQIAAAIAYTEGIPVSQREKDPHNMNNGTYIGYDTYGRLSNQLTTVGKNNKVVGKYINSQSNSNNGAAKVMGGLRYKINDDNSVDVEDPYGFNVSRDFTRTNSHGQPYVYKKGEDPYAGHEWKGLYHDITTSGEGRSIQNIMENFFTRQGKSRKNNIHFEPGEINSRNQLL